MIDPTDDTLQPEMLVPITLRLEFEKDGETKRTLIVRCHTYALSGSDGVDLFYAEFGRLLRKASYSKVRSVEEIRE